MAKALYRLTSRRIHDKAPYHGLHVNACFDLLTQMKLSTYTYAWELTHGSARV